MIAIKDFVMPKGCSSCPFYSDYEDEEDDCLITGEGLYRVKGGERHEECPLVEIDTGDSNKDSGLFWISWLEQNGEKVCVHSKNDALVSLEEAMREIKWIEYNHKETLVSTWVERRNATECIDIPFHRFYVDVFGGRRKIEMPVLVRYTSNATGSMEEVRYKSFEELKKAYDNKDVPDDDTPVSFASIDGVPMNVRCFKEIVNITIEMGSEEDNTTEKER